MRPCALLAVLLPALLCAGCVRRAEHGHEAQPAVAATAATPTEISFAYWALSPREIEAVRELVTDFEAREPLVRVRLVEVTDRYYDKLVTLFATDNAPDVFSINYGRLGDFAREGLLTDLAPLLAASDVLRQDDFVPIALDTFADVGRALGRPGLWGLPRDWGPSNLLLFNRDLLAAEGVPEPDGAWTWNEFADAARRLTLRHADGRPERHGAAVCLYPYAFVAWVYQNEGELFSPDERRSALAHDRTVEAAQFLVRLVREGAIAPPNPAHDQSLELFRTGRVALAFATPYTLGELRRQEGLRWGLAPPPRGRARATGCIPTGVAISARSREQQAAFRFLEHWVTEGARRVAAAGLCVPAWRPALDSPAMEAHDGFGPDIAAILRETAPYARPHPVSPALTYETVLNRLRQALDAVFIRNATPTAAFARAQAALNSDAEDVAP